MSSRRTGWKPANEALIEARQVWEKIHNPIDRARMKGQWEMIAYFWQNGAVTNGQCVSEANRLRDKARETVADEKIPAQGGW